jgi:hypothetical protein
MEELAADHTDLQSIGDLFLRLNARLFLRFEDFQRKNRAVNRISGGVVTFGSSPPPVALYEGPPGSGRRRDRPPSSRLDPPKLRNRVVPVGKGTR